MRRRRLGSRNCSRKRSKCGAAFAPLRRPAQSPSYRAVPIAPYHNERRFRGVMAHIPYDDRGAVERRAVAGVKAPMLVRIIARRAPRDPSFLYGAQDTQN